MSARRARPQGRVAVERAIGIVAGAASFAGWLLLVARADGAMLGLAFALWCGPLALAVVAASIARVVGRPGGLARLSGDLTSVRRTAPLRDQLRAVGLPGPRIWAIPAVLAVPVLVSVPFSAEVAEGDWSILAGAAFVVLLLGPVGLLAGALVWLLAGLPLLALIGSFRPDARPGDRSAASGLAVLLAGIVVFATTLVLGAPDPGTSSRAARIPQLLALLGLNDSIVEHPALLWVARAAVLVIVAGGVLLARGARVRRAAASQQERRRGRRPAAR